MKRALPFLFLFITILGVQQTRAQQFYPVVITVSTVPPVSPYLNQMLSATSGRLMVRVQLMGQAGMTINVKIMGRLERISPAPFSIALNPSYQPVQPIMLQSGVPVILNNSQMEQTFGNLNESHLVFSGITNSSIKEGINYKLPEGMYRLCLVAYNYSQGNILSDPNMGCTSFSVCYKASAPQIVQPVNGIVATGVAPVVSPASPVVFSWTPPAATCGMAPGVMNYDLEIKEVLPGQTVTDAVNNPYVFQKKSLPSPTFLLDTNLYRNILSRGKKYIVRIKANTVGLSPVEIDNAGLSRPEAFVYGQAIGSPSSPLTPSTDPVVSASSADCSLPAVTNKSPLPDPNIKNSDIKIAGFTLHVDDATRNGDGSFSGNGYVNWKPQASLPSSLKLAVVFSNIRINTDRVVFDGAVQTTTIPSKPAWAAIANSKTVTDLTNKISPGIAKEISDHVSKPAHQLMQLTGMTKVEMPVGLNSVVEGKSLTLAIMNISFTAGGSNMTVLHSFNITEAGPDAWLSMAGTDFCIKPDGFNFTKGTLYLPTDREFKLGSGGEQLSFVLKGAAKAPADLAGGTYLTWNPDGIELITANAEMKLPRTMLVPEDGSGKPVSGDVTAKFKFSFVNWEDWIAEGQITPFQLAGLNGLSFSTTSIYYDHSQKKNPASIVFPDEFTGMKNNSFDGLYIQQLQVTLPPDFKTFNSGDKRTSFAANHLIIDKTGITTHVKASNVIDLKDGNLGGWGFSLKNIGILFVSNTFKNGTMNGELLTPLSSTPLTYSGTLLTARDEMDYQFSVKPESEMKMDMWLATLSIHGSSVFEIKRDVIGTAIKTNLAGDLSINAGGKGIIAAIIPGLKFDQLAMANRNPSTKADELYLNWGTWSFSSPDKSVGGFPVKISKINPYATPAIDKSISVGLKFDLGIDVGFGEKSVVSAVTTLDVRGKLIPSLKSAPSAKFEDLSVDKVAIKGDVGPVSVSGLLEFYKQDVKFGNGLKGKVEADFKIVKVDATAQFGKTITSAAYNYWFIDARAAFPKAIPLVGPLGISGFGGGAFYNMDFSNEVPKGSDLGTAISKPEDITPGKTMSGLNFFPQQGKAGLRATIITALTDPKSFNGDITLSAVIDMKKGSFSKFGLSGNAYFVSDYPANKNPFVKAAVDASYDIPNSIFNLNATVDAKFLSVTARVPIGVYADPSKWFVKVGDPFGQRVSFTFLDMNSALLTAKLNATAYLAAGNVLEGGLPPLPTEITNMPGMPASNPDVERLVDDINRTPGGGFMLGAQVRGDFRASFLFLYAQAQAILGFDLMLKNFNEPVICGGKPAGINDWYAIGQLYAYLKADIGIHVDVWFYEGDLSLCKVEAGAILNGGLPNPAWAQGRFAVKGEVLAGAVKVNTNFQFEMGDKCYPASSDPLKDFRIISDYGPLKADVFDEPYAVANVPLEELYEINIPPTAENPKGEIRQYRFSIRSFSIMLGGKPLPEDGFKLSADKLTVQRRHLTIFEPRKTYTAKIICVAEQYYPSEARWDHPYNDKTKRREEHREETEFSFKTGDAPITIPDKNVVFSYPIQGQRFLLKNEMNGSGKLMLHSWQPDLFKPGGTAMRYDLLYINISRNDTIRSSFTPDEASRTLQFKLPAELSNNTTYRLVFWPKKREIAGGFEKGRAVMATRVNESTRTITGGGTVTINNRVASTATTKAGDVPIYTILFRTSQYNTFNEKLASLGDWKGKISGNKMNINNTGTVTERFDEYEIRGYKSPNGTSYGPLLNIQLDWEQSKQNDLFVRDKLYTNALVLSVSGAPIDFAARETRKEIYKPVYTLDWSHMLTEAPMVSGEIISQKVSGPKANVAVAPGSLRPASSLNLSSAVTASNGQLNFGTISPISHRITWRREEITIQDYRLMKSFATNILNFQPTYNQLQRTLGASALEDDNSPQLFTSNSIGGTAYIPLNRLSAVYNSNANMNIIRMLKNQAYEYLPKTGNRTLTFKYGYKGMPVSTINKTLSF